MEIPPATSVRFSEDVIREAVKIFGDEAQGTLQSMAKPVHTYYVRCNTLKIFPDELISLLRRKGLEINQLEVIPEAIGIGVKGPFEIAPTEYRITVDKKTAESVLQGANVYAPGIVNCESMHMGDLVTIISEIGEIVAVGEARMNATDVLTFKKGLAVSVTRRRFHSPQIRELDEFSKGFLYPQSMAAMATARVLDPKPEETIIDMNCAPGGKLSHLSQLMGNHGRILGFDRNSRKLRQTRDTMTKLGCKNVVLAIHDSRYLPDDFPDLKSDRVLIDPPCSALGLRPKAFDYTRKERIEHLAAYQKQFVKAASQIVKHGGIVVYSVCTFTQEECEKVVEFAVQECELNLVEQNLRIGGPGLDTFPKASLCQRFHPDKHEIGYFIAKFVRD
ncbi:MAG: PUA domain-containing protein [Candidatus Bathyarchaeia archaeon]|jgi:predicted RNA-binding protein (TIGR00451 family)